VSYSGDASLEKLFFSRSFKGVNHVRIDLYVTSTGKNESGHQNAGKSGRIISYSSGLLLSH